MEQHRYYSDDLGERQPLSSGVFSSYRPQQQQYRQPYPSYHDAYNSHSETWARAHPDTAFDGFQGQTHHNGREASNRLATSPYAAAGGDPPKLSPHRDPEGHYWAHNSPYPPATAQSSPYGYPSSQRTFGTSPSFGNVSNSFVAGAMSSSVAMNSFEHHPRRSAEQDHGSVDRGLLTPGEYHSGDRNSHGSMQGLAATAAPTGQSTPGQRASFYTDDPYQNLSRHVDSDLGVVNPQDIADDGDDGLEYGRKGPRTSMLSLGSSRGAGANAVGGAASSGMLNSTSGRNGSGSVNNQYASINNADVTSGGSGSIYNAGAAIGGAEKGEWQAEAIPKKSRRWRLVVIFLLGAIVLGAIIVGILLGVVFKNKDKNASASTDDSSSGSSVSTAEEDLATNGDLNKNSPEIKALLNNPNLRKVFPGIDYTPLNTQYPECLTFPPSQNNITRDMAVLSQLTNVVRLYGTDCNQTEMVIHAIDRLELKGTVKIWLGVWQDNNATTNERQLNQMWNILDKYDHDYFKGVIVANEILFREQMTIWSLGQLLEEVRLNMTGKGYSLPVATSDLGDRWDATLASKSDAIMANIHPFFAGEPATSAAKWTRTFWKNKAGDFMKKDKSMNIIAETGWPSQGGTGCGNEFEIYCPQKAVAGIKEMNIFMEDWVCEALEDGTNYFWFEAFDEPWKVRFNTEGKEWEDHWGLFDVNRNLKPGLKIPDCGGKRIS